jgi:hypothetical protein
MSGTAATTALAAAHLQARLRPLHAALRLAVGRQTAQNEQLTRPDLTPFCVSAQEADLLLERTAAGLDQLGEPPSPARATDPGTEQTLRRSASAAGAVLPLDDLARLFRLSRAEQDALLLAVAPELDRGWERAYAYAVDDLNRRLPSIELVVTVLSAAGSDPAEVRRLLGPAGSLRRYGLLRPVQSVAIGRTLELVAGPGIPEFLLGAGGAADLLGDDPDEVLPPPGYAPPPQLPEATLRRLGEALAGGRIDLLGLWGGAAATQRDAALAVAVAAGRPLRRLPDGLADVPETGPDRLRAGARVAAELGALLWIPVDDLAGPAGHAVLDLLVRSRVPALLTGAAPFRPSALLAARGYAELEVPAADYGRRREMWSMALPGLADGVLTDLAARYRMTGEELRAVAAVARAGARLEGNGRPAPLDEHVAPAIAAVTRGRSAGQVRGVTPVRSMDELVLPAEQFAHVREIGAAFRTWPRVAESWGFRRRSGDAGVKVLFTGEPGTGKTLSAEVLAGSLSLELLCVDLSQVVSKWVGETEKNLESAFRQAEESQALLFFDEADALFGKRGQVKHGTDRYANLEVGYLLQRLEGSDALVILASNLRENIDPAFTRRFHFSVHFPRPGPAERLRLWRQAFPAAAPLAPDVDLDALARLDMTGAGIVSAARSAALLAADAGEGTISMRDVVRGVARQYQREARLLRPAELGVHAPLLGETGARVVR